MSGTLLLALAGVAGAGSAQALGLTGPVTLPAVPPVNLPSLPPVPALPKAPVVSVPTPFTSAAAAAGGAVSSAGAAAGGTITNTTGSVGSSLPAPVGGVASSAGAAVGGAVRGGSTAVGGTVGGVSGGGTGITSSASQSGGTSSTGSGFVPGIPVLPVSSPNPEQTATAGQVGTPIAGSHPLTSANGAKGSKPTGGTSSALNPAGISLAQAWASGPSPLLLAANLQATAPTATSATTVPGPMPAAAAQASNAQDGDLLGFVSRHALPGLLVAIATALVGLVAAGNIKALEPQLAVLALRLHALDARAKALILRRPTTTASAPAKRVKRA